MKKTFAVAVALFVGIVAPIIAESSYERCVKMAGAAACVKPDPFPVYQPPPLALALEYPLEAFNERMREADRRALLYEIQERRAHAPQIAPKTAATAPTKPETTP